MKPLRDRAAFVVVSPDAIDVQKEFASSRNWKFKMLQYDIPTFGKDYEIYRENRAMPAVLSFIKNESGQVEFVAKSNFGPGDNFCVMWDMIDMLPKGIKGWQPKYEY